MPLGRAFVLNLIIELATRTPAKGPRGRPRSAEQPALVLEAVAGGGRTTVLATAAGWLAGTTPLVFLDADRCRGADPGAVLAAIAEELGRPWDGYAGMRFPRLRRALSGAEGRRPGRAPLSDHAAPARAAVCKLDPPGGAASWREWLARRRAADGRRRPPPAAVAGERLVGLCEAFLADLDDVYAHRRRADEWTRNCVLLVDNADDAVARVLLHALIDARLAWRRTPPPLTIVAASRGALLAAPVRAAVETVEPAATRHRIGAASGWLRYRLPELTEAETGELLPGVTRTHEQVRRLVHQLTGGHAGMARRMVDDWTTNQDAVFSPAAVLDDQGDQLLAELVGDLPRDRPQLMWLAAARVAEHAWWLHDEGLVADEPSWTLPPPVAAALWDGGPAPTLLRRLLLRRLAGTAAAIDANWTDAYSALATRAGKFEPEAVPYYRLAAGTPAEIGQAVSQLTDLLPTMPESEWVELVESVAQAPCPLRPVPPPHRGAAALALYQRRAGDESAAVAGRVWRVVAGLWLLADPATGVHRRDIHHQVAIAFGELASDVDGDGQIVRGRKLEHLEETNTWE